MNIDGNFNLTHNTDSVYLSEALANYNVIKEGYTYPIDDLDFTPEDFNKFIVLLNKLHPELTEYDFSDSKKSVFKQYKCNDFVIHVQGNSKEVYATINSKSLHISEQVFKVYKTFHKADTDVKIFMTVYYTDGGRTQNSIKTFNKDELSLISDSYYPYINTDIMYKQYFSLEENILILAGKPGIGKSKMVSSILRYATENDNLLPYDKCKDDGDVDVQFINIAYVKSNAVLSDDSFWRDLETREFDFVVLDDLDYFLTSRDAEVTSQEEANKNKFLNQFLSFTDGIEKHRTKFIITTNQPYDDLDTALLRKGRLFDILELRDLSYAEAAVIWKEAELEFSDFEDLYQGSGRILPADLGSEISRRTNDKISDACEGYLLEDNISKVKEATTKEKVGF